MLKVGDKVQILLCNTAYSYCVTKFEFYGFYGDAPIGNSAQ